MKEREMAQASVGATPGGGPLNSPTALDRKDSATCRTVLIADAPSREDKFKTHGRVARAIADLIKSDADAVSVGVEGSWGSGKTTVYQLLVTELKTQPDYSVLLFDAWAHEGDPLRLTFLQSVLRHFVKLSPPWIMGCGQSHPEAKEKCEHAEGCRQREMEKELERIAGRRQTEVTKEYPRLSPAGVAMTISLLLVPLSAALANAALRNDKLTLFDFQASVSVRALVLFAFAFASLPLLVFLGSWLQSRARGQKRLGEDLILTTPQPTHGSRSSTCSPSRRRSCRPAFRRILRRGESVC